MRLPLFLAFLAVPVLEIVLIILVGSAIGGWATVGLLAAGSLLGAWLVRREGRNAWRALQESVQGGRLPERGLADGGVVLAGGVLLMVPGFLTDLVGLACVLPVTRPLMRRLGTRFLDRRIRRLAEASPYAEMFPQQAAPPQQQEGKVVYGEVIREDR
ncbi:MAG: FxsA family protein [Nonomuraea sp.]|nr:FxsA family protein [Nonomuraea sp.]